MNVSTAQWAGSVAQWAAVAISLIALGVSSVATGVWRRTLRSKRGDDAIGAAFDLRASLGALKAAVERKAAGEVFGASVDRMYASFSEMLKTYVIAQRSTRGWYRREHLPPANEAAWLSQIHKVKTEGNALFGGGAQTTKAFNDAWSQAFETVDEIHKHLLSTFPK